MNDRGHDEFDSLVPDRAIGIANAELDQPERMQLVEVCDSCLRVCCWYGEFICDDAKGAGTIRVHIEDLRRLRRESSEYWDDAPTFERISP